MYATKARRARPEPFAVRPGIAERLGLPYMDFSLGFAAIALAAISIYTLEHATAQDIPGDPGYYSNRQALYAVLGLVGMYLLSRIDYSRFREVRVGIYTLLCASVSLVLVFGFAARGSRRSFELPLFSFQPSEIGKLLLVLALAGFVIDGARRGSPWRRTVRYLCLGLAPAALGFPAAGPRHLTGVRGHHPRRDVCGGRPLDAHRSHHRRAGSQRRIRPRRCSQARDADSQGVSATEAHLVLPPQRRPQQRRLPARSGARLPSAPVRRPAVATAPPRRGSISFPSATPTSSSR